MRIRIALLAFVLGLGVARVGLAQGAYDDASSGDVMVGTIATEHPLPEPPPGYARRRYEEADYVYPRHYADDLEALERHRRVAWERIGTDLGIVPTARVVIRIARKPEEMFAMAPVGLPPPSYASGVAYPDLGVVLLTLTTHDSDEPVPDVARVLTHELSHVALHRAAGGRPLPRWFSEGVAIHHSDENSINRIRALWEGASQERLAPIASLTSRFADGSAEVSLAYAQAADVVAFLLRRPHGADKMRRMLAAVRDGATFEAALEGSFFYDLAELDRDWRKDVDERVSAVPLVLGGGGLWAVVVVALAIGFVRRRRRNRATLVRWANEDAAIDSLEAELERKLAAAEQEREARARELPDASRSEPGIPTDRDGNTLH